MSTTSHTSWTTARRAVLALTLSAAALASATPNALAADDPRDRHVLTGPAARAVAVQDDQPDRQILTNPDVRPATDTALPFGPDLTYGPAPGKPCTITSSAAGIEGTPYDDVICATGYNLEQRITGIGGNDIIYADNAFRTIINTGDGRDEIHLGDGASSLVSTYGGGDTVYAGAGQDVVHGGPGDDRLFGRGGEDRLHGEGGNDSLYGGSGVNTLDGGSGSDYCTGGSFNMTSCEHL